MGIHTAKRITLKFSERVLILDELRKVCKPVDIQGTMFSIYDAGWTDEKLAASVCPVVPNVTPSHVATIRREAIGDQVRAPMNGGRPDSAWYKRVVELENRIKHMEDWIDQNFPRSFQPLPGSDTSDN